jgi:predicted Ser/Thr protein kinase
MSALLPHIHPRASERCGDHPCDSEGGREFLQDRLAVFGKVGCLLGSGFFVLAYGLSAFDARFTLSHLLRPAALLHLGVCALLGLLWWICRRRFLCFKWLRWTDQVTTFLVCLGVAFIALTDELSPHREFKAVLAATNVLLARAVIVPSSAARSFWVSIISFAPAVAAAHQLFSASHPPEEALRPAALETAFVGLWCLLAAALTAVASRVIYGLRVKVQEARQLGQYTLEEKLGEGGMGEVYRARHSMLRRPTAIKLLRPEKAGETSLARFEREVQLTSRLTHPNTIAIYDYGRTPEGVFYYAMEYLDGLTLDQLVQGHGPQPEARAIHILEQVCASLIEAHGTGLIHRDIKPANIIICERGGNHDVVKLLDFGLVKPTGAERDAGLTGDNIITGTPLYLSPEAIRSPETMDARSDLYAVGAVAYYLVTGKNVFEGGSFLEICTHHLHSPPVPPSKRIGRTLAPDLEGLILMCLEKNPGHRPREARALHEALQACSLSRSWGEEEAAAWWRSSARGADGRIRASAPATATATALPDALTVQSVVQRTL